MKITKAIMGVTVALCTLAITYTASASEATDLPTHLMNGSFEIPVAPNPPWIGKDDESSVSYSGPWYIKTAENFEKMASSQGANGFYWKTTANNQKIELVSKNRETWAGSLDDYNISAPYDNNQFAELVAEEQSSLYQNISTPVEGTVLNWGLAHAGRNEKDTMALFIGPMQSDLTKSTYEGNDIFMWMGELIKNTSQIEWKDAQTGMSLHTIFSQKDIDLSQVTSDNYTEYFSFSKTATINQEWRCWIITDDKGKWGEYNGVYTVPDNQPVTTFAFTAITGGSDSSATNGQLNTGNLLDGITFATTFPLRVATTEGGTGTVTVKGTAVADVTYDKDHIAIYDDGTEITVSAKANEGYHLLGAFINGVFCTGNDEGHFTENSDGSLSHSVVMDAPRYVQLIFAKEGTVIYDPNGGTYNGTTKDTEITMASIPNENEYSQWTNPYGDAVPANDKTNFIGWYVGRITHNGVAGGALVSSNHTITYNTGNIPGNTADDTLDLTYELVVRDGSDTQQFDFSDGLVFIAEWEYLQEAEVKTKLMEDAYYTDSDIGGTVTQTIKDYDSDNYRTNGWGRLRDIVTLHAKAADGYRFRGWYDEDGNQISIRDVYEYEVAEPTKVYAYFSELHHPLTGFVSATGEEQLENKGTHIVYGKTGAVITDAQTGIGGESIYGNTISTSFITKQVLDANTPYNFSQWSITLPAPTADKPIYIKKTSAQTSNDFEFESEPIIIDSDNVQVNNGNIYKVTGFTSGADSLELHLFNELPVTTLTNGDIEIIYNITLDNIYAPGAEATLDLKKYETDMLFESKDIREDGSKFIHSETLDEYLTDSDNEYSKVVKSVSEVE